MAHAVQRQALENARQAEAVVAVEVRDADPGDVGGRDPGLQHLALGAFAGVEQDPLAVPAQEVAVLVAIARGHLAGGAQHDEFSD